MTNYIVYLKKNCPICEQSLELKISETQRSAACINRCYVFIRAHGFMTVNVFGRVFIMDNFGNGKVTGLDNEKQETRINERINYWKENDRYLVKILEGDT